MTNKRKSSNMVWRYAQIFILFNIMCFASLQVSAQTNQGSLQKVGQLQHPHGQQSKWQQLVANPSNKNQFFIANDTGQLYLVDEMKLLQPILDLPSLNEDKSTIKLTAFELHPNFSLRDQPGYGTFYTAHLENIDENSSTKRLQENNSETPLIFDAVITEWRFNSVNYQQVDLQSKREVLRIAVPENNMTISQLSFNPYIKSWNDDFGLLYIALNGHDKAQEPLYSGVLLRINPAKFGLRSFTVPTSNPYIMEKNIKDEIYLLGAQTVQQFIWSSKSSDEMLLSHQYKGKHLLSLTKGKNDWREISPENILYQSNDIIEDNLLYLGSDLPSLRNNILLLTKKNKTWFTEALTVKPSVIAMSPSEKTPQPIWQFNEASISDNSELMLSQNFNNELILLDKNNGMVFELAQGSPSAEKPLVDNFAKVEQDQNSLSTWYLLFILIAIGIAVYFYKRNQFSAKAIVRKHFAHIELSESQQQIGLYHRHQKSTDTIIDLSAIVQCEITLNDSVINVIDIDQGNGFDEFKEQNLRDVFAKEKVDKMVDGKIRQINITFTMPESHQYIVCIYMRKGSDRITKKSYGSVIEEVIDWCWLFATKINPSGTPKRKKKEKTPEKSTSREIKQPKNSLHEEAAMSRQPISKASQKSKPIIEPVKENKNNVGNAPKDITASEQPLKKSRVDTDLVNALEKLVDLKQQGYLTQEEFIKAKENLMRSLLDEE